MGEKISRSNYEANLNFLIDNNLIDKEQKILEIGSGKGKLLNYLNKNDYHIVGCDSNKNFISRALEIYGDDLPIFFTKGVKIDNRDNEFDTVISFDVLEHIPDTDAHLQEVWRLLKPSGKYLFGIPNKLTNVPFSIYKHRSFSKYKKWHCSLHTSWEIRRRLNNNGYNCKIYDQKVMSKFLRNKIKENFGRAGLFFLRIFDLDKLPNYLKPTIYVEATKYEQT